MASRSEAESKDLIKILRCAQNDSVGEGLAPPVSSVGEAISRPRVLAFPAHGEGVTARPCCAP